MKLYIYKEPMDDALRQYANFGTTDGFSNICVFTKEEIFENCDDEEGVYVLELDTNLLIPYLVEVKKQGRLVTTKGEKQ